MRKFREIIAIILVLSVTVGTVAAVFFYESIQTKKRNAYGNVIELKAIPVSKWSKKEIIVKKGELVKIRLVNASWTVHGFAIPGLNVKETVIAPGDIKMVEFTPKTPGVYEFACTVQCGKGHESMKGKLIVK